MIPSSDVVGSKAGTRMSRVIEAATGAQILPPAAAQRATVTWWVAHVAADADLRTKSPVYAALADELEVHP